MKERGDNMRILVISDSHGQLGNLNKILKEAGKVDRVIHLGDAVGQDEEIREMCGCPVTIVRGNCDFYSKNELVEIVEEENVKICVMLQEKKGAVLRYTDILMCRMFHIARMYLL